MNYKGPKRTPETKRKRTVISCSAFGLSSTAKEMTIYKQCQKGFNSWGNFQCTYINMCKNTKKSPCILLKAYVAVPIIMISNNNNNINNNNNNNNPTCCHCFHTFKIFWIILIWIFFLIHHHLWGILQYFVDSMFTYFMYHSILLYPEV